MFYGGAVFVCVGVASRLCVYNSLSSTGGSWVRPDLSKCVTPQILEINKEVMVFVIIFVGFFCFVFCFFLLTGEICILFKFMK